MFDPTAEDITGWALRQTDDAAQAELLDKLRAAIPQTPAVPPSLHELAGILRDIADRLDALAGD